MSLGYEGTEMGDLDEVEDVLGRLEHDRNFRKVLSEVREGIVSRVSDDTASRAYRCYVREIERFTESPPTMRLLLSDPALKIWFFRVFGYLGEMQFTLRQAVWFRELPLLDIGRDAHLGYGMMLGTSQMLPDGESAVLRRISIGERTFFNQHAVVEGGVSVGADCSIGIRTTIGSDAQISNEVEIGDYGRIGDEAVISDRCQIGAGASIGRATIVDAGVKVEEGAQIPAYHRLTRGGLFVRALRRIAA